MKTMKLTGMVQFGNILNAKKYNMSQNKFVDDPNGSFNLTVVVDENDKYLAELKQAFAEKVDEIKQTDKFKKLETSTEFASQIKKHTDKDGNVIAGKYAVSLKRNRINAKQQIAKIDIYNEYGQPYEPINDIGYGSKVQVMYSLYDNYIAKDKKWYVTYCLLAVLIEEEAQSSYDWDVKKPDINVHAESVAGQFDGEVVPPITEQELAF